jgi:hypothetical protein
VKLVLRAAAAVLFGIAVYFRSARHDALKYYLFFLACAVVLVVSESRNRKRS